jgi:hypothetical protein
MTPTVTTAAVTAVTFAALYAGHQVGDHVAQSGATAAAKGAPIRVRLAAGVHPWTGWGACLRHVSAYTFVQAVALALVSVVAPLGVAGAVASLAVSASTHAVIDRRWVVRLIIEAKGCRDWREGPYLIDQSLHSGALLVAAVVAAAVTDVLGVAAVTVGAVALVGLALIAEQRLARRARAEAVSHSG